MSQNYRFRFSSCSGNAHASYTYWRNREEHRLEVYHDRKDIITDGLYVSETSMHGALALDILLAFNAWTLNEYETGKARMIAKFGAAEMADYPPAPAVEQWCHWSTKTSDVNDVATYTWYRVDLAGAVKAIHEHKFNYRTFEEIK